MGRLVRAFGDNLRYYRKAAGLTQSVLAQRVGVTVKTLSSLEGGHRSPALSLLERLADTLRLEAWQLLDVGRSATADREALRGSDLADLSPDSRQVVSNLVALLKRLSAP